MTTVLFNEDLFRKTAPAYACCKVYPDDFLQTYWDLATNYITNNSATACYEGMTLGQQVTALNLMAAHLLALTLQTTSGQGAGLVTGATIDKVSVTLTPPPEMNQWQWWLNQTPYGQQLLSLLQVAAAGGRFFTAGGPVVGAFRRRWR